MSDRASLFRRLSPAEQLAVLRESPAAERLARFRLLPLDDAADLIQAAPDAQRDGLLGLLEDVARSEVTALLAYAEDVAGGLMNPRFVRLRPEFRVDEAIRYLRIHGRDFARPISDAYVLDAGHRLLGAVSLLDLFSSPENQTIDCVMTKDPITVTEDADQESVSQLFREYDLLSVPVVDDVGRMKGVVTVDDIVDAFRRGYGRCSEDRRRWSAPGTLSADELLIDGAQQRWLVSAAVSRGDSDNDGDGVVRGPVVARDRAGPVSAAAAMRVRRRQR